MNDEHLDRAVRDADPYRPEYARNLGGAEQTLLEEIMSVPTIVRRPPVRRWAIAVAAAAAVTGVFAATALIGHHPNHRAAIPPSATHAPTPAPKATAKQYPVLLIDDPAWKATMAYGFADASGAIKFAKGKLTLEMEYYPGGQYGSYEDDMLGDGPDSPVSIDGWPGSRTHSTTNPFAVVLRPRDGAFVEIYAASDGWNRAEFDRVLAKIRRVDTAAWYAAMPPEIVTPPDADRAAAKVLADVPLPPGFDIGTLDDLGVNDQYHFIAGASARAACGWITEWVRADQTGDRAAKTKAAAALRGSRQWKGTRQIADEGDFSSIFWMVLDQAAKSGPPAGYKDTIGCQ